MPPALLATAVLAAAVAACGGGGSGPRPPAPAPAPAPDASPAAADDAPTARECEAVLDHALALRTAGVQPPLTAGELGPLREELRTAFAADCRAGSRAGYRCAIAATSLRALAACAGSGSGSGQAE